MASGSPYEWEYTITFEGFELPGVAAGIDLIGTNGNPAGLNKETSVWLWRFTICRGRTRKAPKWVIEKCAGEALAKLQAKRPVLVEQFSSPGSFVGEFRESVLDDWEFTLRKMLEIASTRDQCSWSAPE